jgi:glycosyltransferase involved in cell wall biosynthesis
MAKPLVTIVTPSLNQGRFIRATVESVLSQGYQPIEYIVMDGGSTDETAAIVKDYASRLTWISEPDRGQSHAINKGFRMGKGEILSWINSDDWILPGAVAKAVQGFETEPEAGAVYGEGFRADRDGKITGNFLSTEPPNLWKLVHLSDYILQQTVYFRRAALDDLGYLREDLHYAMDWDILIRIAKKYPLHYIPEAMGVLREYPEAKSFSGGWARVREIGCVLREHTGQHFPPGYLLYAMSTYRPRWLRIPWALLEDRLARSQGWDRDGMAGPRVKYMLRAGPGCSLMLCGSVERREELAIWSHRKMLARAAIEPGPFVWRVRIPETKDAVELRIRSKRRFLLRSISVERSPQ